MNQWHDSFSETHLVKSNWLGDVLFSSLRKKLSAVYLILQTFYKKKTYTKSTYTPLGLSDFSGLMEQLKLSLEHQEKSPRQKIS